MSKITKNLSTDLSLKRVQKIAILGAESSGKSALAEALAAHYKTLWVPEYLREFVEVQARVPNSDEQLLIAMTQVRREEQAMVDAREWLFCDTTPLMTEIYSKHYFDEAEPDLVDLSSTHAEQYAFTLVTALDFPWMPDGLQRESPAVRQMIHEQLLEILEEREIPHMLIEGSLKDRVQQVEFALSFLMQ
ncbi:AAA family ATPase [Undibacterium sp. Dicai25W]|uniref:AAA family ATPase n=1 Tax=Undibacterium sp. Dicai25W TaxID=3413034 RepID=UPI003BF34979